MNKKTLVKVISIVTLCITMTVVLTFAINTGFKHEEPLVYVTRTGEKYHSAGCGYLWASSFPRGLDEARKAGYTVCSRCGGKARGTITVNNYGASFGISSLIMCALVCFGFIIYNKFSTYSHEQTNTNSIPTSIMVPPKPSITVKCGDIVSHKSFGKGKVIKLSQSYITIQFVDRAREFVFPSAFIEGFLEKENSE